MRIPAIVFALVCGVCWPVVGATSYKYAYKKGFIGAGNDVLPPQNMTLKAAELKCNALLRCKSLTYRGTNTTTKIVKVTTTALPYASFLENIAL